MKPLSGFVALLILSLGSFFQAVGQTNPELGPLPDKIPETAPFEFSEAECMGITRPVDEALTNCPPLLPRPRGQAHCH